MVGRDTILGKDLAEVKLLADDVEDGGVDRFVVGDVMGEIVEEVERRTGEEADEMVCGVLIDMIIDPA